MSSHRNSIRLNVARSKEPSKRSLDKFLRECVAKIERLQQEMEELRSEINQTNGNLKVIREEKNDFFKEREGVEARIRAMSVDINKATDVQSNLRSNLSYRDEKRLEDTIRRLQTTSLTVVSPTERKKIEDEIQILTRSKKVTIEYREVTERITGLRTAQKQDRDARDRCVKRIAELRRSEDTQRKRIGEIREQHELLQTDLDALVQLKRDRREEFTRRQVEYQTMLDAEQQKAREKRQAERDEIIPAEPNQEEKKLCSLLINFLESQLAADDKRSRRKRFVLNQVILHQFLSLDIRPPTTFDRVPAVIAALQEKHRDLSTLVETPQAPDSPSAAASGAQSTAASGPPSRSVSLSEELSALVSRTVPASEVEFVGIGDLGIESWFDEKVSLSDRLVDDCDSSIQVIA